MKDSLQGTGWVGSARRLPGGAVYRRNPKCVPVLQYEAVSNGSAVAPGRLIRVHPSITHASQELKVSKGNLHECCTYWENLYSFKRTYRPRRTVGVDGKWYIFQKLSGERSRPLVVVFKKGAQPRWYKSAAEAADDLTGGFEKLESVRAGVARCAGASPMYESGLDPDMEGCPTFGTRFGMAWAFYV